MLSTVLLLLHLLGLAMAVGVGAAKVLLLLKCYRDHTLLHSYFKLVKAMTGMLIVGFILLTLTGIAWIATGYPFTLLLGIKVALVVIVWILGPYIDNVAEPALVKLTPAPGAQPSPEFLAAQKKHLVLEAVAEGLFVLIIILWVVR